MEFRRLLAALESVMKSLTWSGRHLPRTAGFAKVCWRAARIAGSCSICSVVAGEGCDPNGPIGVPNGPVEGSVPVGGAAPLAGTTGVGPPRPPPPPPPPPPPSIMAKNGLAPSGLDDAVADAHGLGNGVVLVVLGGTAVDDGAAAGTDGVAVADGTAAHRGAHVGLLKN